QRQPVREVDHVLVLDPPPGDLRGQPVVAARRVGARVVDVVGGALRQGAPGGEAAVAQRAQRLPEPLVGGVVALVLPGPAGHLDAPSRQPPPGSLPADGAHSSTPAGQPAHVAPRRRRRALAPGARQPPVTGTHHRSVVPPPGELSMSRVPPSCSARSAMLRRPLRRPPSGRPTPSSVTVRRTSRPSVSRLTWTRPARA